MFIKSTITAALAGFIFFSFTLVALAAMPRVDLADQARNQSLLKQLIQNKRYRGPCRRGDEFNRAQRQCKGATSAVYAPGDPAAGRCKAGDYYATRRQDCIGPDKKRYAANAKQAVSFTQSKKAAKDRRQKRQAALAKKHGCKSGDGWNRRKKMCVHYYKGKN